MKDEMMVTNGEELNEKLENLTALTRSVYEDVQANLYEEAGFSDVYAEDVACRLHLSEKQVAGRVSHLVRVGLMMYVDPDCGSTYNTVEHYKEIQRI